MGLGDFTRKWLGKTFGNADKGAPDNSPPALVIPKTPDDMIAPFRSEALIDHVRFLLQAKAYVANHAVPPDRQGQLNQYSHAGRPLIDEDRSRPAMTNCSYEFYGRKFISIGMPLFIKQASWIKDNDINPAFHSGHLWDSMERLIKHHAGELGHGESKYGYYLPTNHYYIEKPVPPDVFDKAQSIIDFYTRTDITEPQRFLDELTQHMRPQSAARNNAQPPERKNTV